MSGFLVVRLTHAMQVDGIDGEPALYAAPGSVLGLPESMAKDCVRNGHGELLSSTVASFCGAPAGKPQ